MNNFSTFLCTCMENNPPATHERDEPSLGKHLPRKLVSMLSMYLFLLWKGKVLAVLLTGFSLARKICRSNWFPVRSCWGGVGGTEAKTGMRLLFPGSELFSLQPLLSLSSSLLPLGVSLRRHYLISEVSGCVLLSLPKSILSMNQEPSWLSCPSV